MKLKHKIDRTIALGSGGAFLGVLLFQIPGAVIGGIAAGIYGWVSARTKLKGLNPATGEPTDKYLDSITNEPTERFLKSLKNYPTAQPESKGLCAHCGEPVYDAFPWYVSNPYKGAAPIHQECAKSYFFGDN